MQVVEQDNLSSIIREAGKPVFVDFYADWCGPCKMTSPIFEQLNKEYGEKVLFVKVNVDQNPVSSADNNVRSIPTFIAFNSEGKAEVTHVGGAPKNVLENMIKKYT